MLILGSEICVISYSLNVSFINYRGVGDLMLDAANDDLIQFLKLLSRSRAAVVDYFIHGSLTSPPVLSPALVAKLASSNGAQVDYDTVVTSSWRLGVGRGVVDSVLVLLVGVTEEDYSYTILVNFHLWGFSDAKQLNVWSIDSNGTRSLLGSVSGPMGEWDVKLSGRSARMLEFTKAVV